LGRGFCSFEEDWARHEVRPYQSGFQYPAGRGDLVLVGSLLI
jgi:hypothetical protein